MATTSPAQELASAGTKATASGARLVSLDVFRGLTIAGMTLVNNPGDWDHIYAPLEHAEWNGWTPTDLIFPFFVFIVGVSMQYSLAARTAKGASRTTLLRHVAVRSAIIFALGLFLNGFPYFRLSTWRIPGVLQRIAVCYLIAAPIVLFLRRRWQIAAIVLLLFGYWALMTLVPVPDFGTGGLDPEGNLAAYIDRVLMLGHLWKPRWDPEGILSTLPAIATALLGALAGEWLRSSQTPNKKCAGLLVMGVLGLCLGMLWNRAFPINKNLWTSSYVIFTAGFAAVVLGVCYWLVDIRGWRAWAKPFVVYGTNAIALYVLSSLMAKLLIVLHSTTPEGEVVSWHEHIYSAIFVPLASPINASLLFALAYVVFWLGAMWILYAKKIFIKI